jgi:homoserine dehydrogenase
MTVKTIAIIGFGTVGTGVARLLHEESARLTLRSGCQLKLKHVVVNDVDKQRDVKLPAGVVTDDIQRVIDDQDVDIVAQLVGGIEPARTIMVNVLTSGKDVVTANKALLAEHGAELFNLAREVGQSIAFEASVAGGVPIIAGIGRNLSANQVTSLRGILNGTSNFIVSQMEEAGANYAAAVAEAQARGYAEADPTMDVDGTDAAQKLSILAHLAFGANVNWQAIPRVGIDTLQTVDLHYASELGYRIKLLAVADLADSATPKGIDLHVSPTLVRIGTPLAEVRGANNAISVVGDAVGPVFFHGLGAGQMPTASAVVADIVDLAVGRAQLTFNALQLWSDRPAAVAARDPALAPGRYYIRLRIDDQPGVLADVAGVLGTHKISIASVIQHEPEDQTGQADLVIMTHTATAGAMNQATTEIEALQVVRQPVVRMRVLERD